MINIYTPEGWLDIPSLRELGCWLYAIIGPRQVGKTYGVIKNVLEENRQHLFLRRTIDELDTVLQDETLNPYYKMQKEGYYIGAEKRKNMYVLGDIDASGKITSRRGLAMALSSVHKIRGFSGEVYTDLILDEFIPEEIAIVREAEGSALLNALVTINGNRELEGKAPITCWLLANSNRIDSPILRELGLVPLVEDMLRKEEEIYIDDGICILMPKSQVIVEKRKETALIKHLQKHSPKSRFLEMSIDNKFSAKEFAYVAPRSLQGYKPLFGVGKIYCYKQGDILYFTSIAHTKKYYEEDEANIKRFRLEYPYLILLFTIGQIRFDSVLTLILFKKYCNFKEKVL